MDVTVPDGTSFSPGVQFTKVWRLKNVGACTWTNSYSLVFYRGEQMGGPTSVNIPSSVAPGQTVDIAVGMVAPALPGSYRGDWILRNSSGTVFGAGASGTRPIWVAVNVITDTITVTVISPSTITGTVFSNDPTQVTSGFPVTLYDSTGKLADTTTNTDSIYIFPNLNAGTYSVKWIGKDCSGNDVLSEAIVNVNAGETKIQDIDLTVLC